MSLTKEGKIPSLNGWRAIAILLVLASHAAYTKNFPTEWALVHCRVLWELGNLGVRIFFVLSGFLITHLLLKEAEKRNAISFKRFYVRRSLRILPVYLSYLGVFGLLTAFGLYSDSRSSWLGALTFSRNMVGQGLSITGHFWSLAVEEQFYFIWPMCIGLLVLWRRFRLAIILLLLTLIMCPWVRAMGMTVQDNGQLWGRLLGEKSILAYADSLAAGCCGAFLIRRIQFRLSPRGATLTLLTALMAVAGAAMWSKPAGFVTAIIPTVQAVAIIIAIWTTIYHTGGWFGRFLNTPLMDWLGVLSYSLYIWHLAFVYHYTSAALGKLAICDWRIWWLPAVAMAVFSYYCVERPILRFKDKFSNIKDCRTFDFQPTSMLAGLSSQAAKSG
jgi:peptidoglycan/LPS O-acetylase OafA/YrhL